MYELRLPFFRGLKGFGEDVEMGGVRLGDVADEGDLGVRTGQNESFKHCRERPVEDVGCPVEVVRSVEWWIGRSVEVPEASEVGWSYVCSRHERECGEYERVAGILPSLYRTDGRNGEDKGKWTGGSSSKTEDSGEELGVVDTVEVEGKLASKVYR
jgi:hypothetical protein